MRGGWVKVAPPRQDIDDVLYAKAQRETMLGLHRTQLVGPQAAAHAQDARSPMHVDHKPLSSRTMRLDPPVKPLRSAHIVQAQRTAGNALETRQLALKLLREGQVPPSQPGRRGAVLSYLALQSAAAFLDEDTDEKDAQALLTPARGWPRDAQELAEMLQQAGDDAHALAELLEDVEGLPKDPSELYNLLKNIRYDPPALAQLLRKAQGLPQDKQALRALRQQVHDALRELERTEGSLIRATLNAGEAAGKAPDPETFLDTYSEIVHGSGGFADTFKKLLERFRPEKLRNAVELMKKALGDDLNATVAMPSRDLVRLQAILTDLSYMHVSTTLLEATDKLIEFMNRTCNAQPAAAAP